MQTIAIIGLTCSGKTSCGSLVASQLGLPFRSCGDVVRARAKALGISISEFPEHEHRKIDAETLEWCHENNAALIEGRYLDQVLWGIRNKVVLIGLSADLNVRARRLADRDRKSVSTSHVLMSDRIDAGFRKIQYAGVSRIKSNLDLDTSLLSKQECVGELMKWIEINV